MPRHSPYALLSLNFQFFKFSQNKFPYPFFAFRFLRLSLANNWLGYHFLLFWKDHVFYFSPFLAHCSLPNLNRKDLNLSCMISHTTDSLKIFSQLSVRFFTLSFYSVFNEHFFSQSAISHFLLVGLSGLEPPTSRLSGARSNLLSYKPMW